MFLILAMAAALSAEPQAPAPAPAAPTSEAALKRIGAAVAKPSALDVTLPEPTFRVEVRGRQYYTEIPWEWNFGTGKVTSTGKYAPPTMGPGGSTPLFVIDVLPIARALRKARSQKEANDAREEAQREFAEFCKTHAC